MKHALKYLLASTACFGLTQQAHAAKWGAMVDKGCNPSGGRLYTAKIWTGISDKGPSAECKRTKGKVGNRNSVPDRCVNKKAGPLSVGVVYGEWTVSDASCPAPGALQRPAVMPPVQPGKTPTNTLQRKQFSTSDPLATMAYKLEDLGSEAIETFRTIKATIAPITDKLLGIDDLKIKARNMMDSAAFAKYTPLAHDLSKALTSDDANAIAARAHILNKDNDKAMASLSKLPAFVTLSDTVENDPWLGSVTIGLVGDAQYIGTLNGEVGVALGKVAPTWIAQEQPDAETPPPGTSGGMAHMPYYALGYGAGVAKGGDVSVAVGFWRSPITKLKGDSHGIVIGAAKKYGVSASFWWGYATDTDDNPNNDKQVFKIKPSEFLGFVIAPQLGMGVEAEYNRAFLKEIARPKTFRR
ncbi:MAG: hypothetical protein AAGF20_04800 [Pseudomonadota bacterium]